MWKNQTRRCLKRRTGSPTIANLCCESLEPRHLLAAQVLISELVASNEQGIRDEDGDREDWIEIYNAGDEATDLGGWYLTDDEETLSKWQFPSTPLGPDERVVVFASGKDRSAGQLHTNFRLSRNGEFLALVRPDAVTIGHGYTPSFPLLPPDRAYGIPQATEITSVASADTQVRALVPTELNGESLGLSWTEIDFDDSDWLAGESGVGFDPSGGFDEFIGLNIGEQLLGLQSSAYVRKAFEVDIPAALSSLKLGIQYEDGFVAYLNGVEVARANAPDDVRWDSVATRAHRNSQAVQFVEFDLTSYTDLLIAGRNMLAVHGMNRTTSSNDFLIGTHLTAVRSLPLESTEPRFFEFSTPGLPNAYESFAGITEAVVMDRSRGFYEDAFRVRLSSATPGASLVYTVDGSAPSAENGLVVAPASNELGVTVEIDIDATTNLRAVAFKPDHLSAPISTETFFFLEDVIQQSPESAMAAGFPDVWRVVTEPDYGMDPNVVGPNDAYDGQYANVIIDALKAAPTVSISTDLTHLFGEDGIYVNSVRSGADWERPTSVEILMPDGRGFQADAGIRIQGDNVRNLANSKKQSFRLEFREEYGPTKLRFPLFDESDAVDSFDTIILRGGYNDGWVHTPTTTQFIRDQWARETLRAMGHPQVHGRFVHVYLNGVYWGLYNAVERPVASFASDYFGGDKDNWDALNTGQVRDGSAQAWSSLRNLVREVNTDDQAASNQAYLRVLGRNPDGTNDEAKGSLIDIQNYIDYLIVNFYGGNVDWPGRNYYVAREQGSESTGFKFFAWDTEKILNHGEGSTLTTNRIEQRDGVAAAFFSLRGNDEFRLQFADRVHQHFFNGGLLYVDAENPIWDAEHPERNRPADTYNQIARGVELPLVGESARWGDTQSASTRNDGRTFTVDDWLSFQSGLFESYFPHRSGIVLDQFIAAGLYPTLAAPVFSQHGGLVRPGFQLSISEAGTTYYTLDGSDPRQTALEIGVEQSGIAPTALRYTTPIPITGGTVVRARTLVDGQWSALNEATFVGESSAIRVGELMYHPRDGEAGTTYLADDFEFIELVNTSTTSSAQLAGMRFVAGVEVELAETEVAAGERVVVVNNRAAFESRYGQEVRIVGEYGSTNTRLSNGGERLTLEDAAGNVVQSFDFDDAWIPATDGEGFSLVIKDSTGPLEDWSEPEAWRRSVARDGSPGAEYLADFNGDGQTTSADVDRFCLDLRRQDSVADLNDDGSHNSADVVMLLEDVLGVSIGDVNLDGAFDSSDLTSVFQSNLYEDAIEGNALWSQGDWNCDGDFTTRDLVDAMILGGYRDAVGVRPTWAARTNIAAAIVDRVFDRDDRLDSIQPDDRSGQELVDWLGIGTTTSSTRRR